MSKKSQKIWFIVLVSIFATLWVASMVMVSIAAFNETTTLAIENWYKEINTDPNALGQTEEKTLDLYECYKNACHTIAKIIASVKENDVNKAIEFKDGVVVSLICFGLVCFEEEYEGSICGIKGNIVKKSKDYEEYILDLLKAIYKVFKLRSILDEQDEDGERGDTNSSYVNKLFIHDIEGKLMVLMKSKHKEISQCAIELYDVLMKGN